MFTELINPEQEAEHVARLAEEDRAREAAERVCDTSKPKQADRSALTALARVCILF